MRHLCYINTNKNLEQIKFSMDMILRAYCLQTTYFVCRVLLTDEEYVGLH